ncbi:hypothetical protein [Rhizobium sp. 2YAF20]|uniref:hypothetical protein n=1 Tax=Rhizobium sp. 2YAF20 TaxID=3233027 RepID=UPI003F9B2662
MSALRHQKSFCMGDEATLSQEVVIEEGNEAAVGGGIEDSVSLDAQTFRTTDDLLGDLEAGAEARINILVKGGAHADAIRSADLPSRWSSVSERMPLLPGEAMPTAIFIDFNPRT